MKRAPWIAAGLAVVAAAALVARSAPDPANDPPVAAPSVVRSVTSPIPDRKLTPGATDPRVTQATIAATICVPGWSTRARPTLNQSRALKRAALKLYRYTGPWGDVEADHLIPISLGGASTVANLWPEPWERRGNHVATPGTGAETKDRIEGRLYRDVCAHRRQLADAQHAIATYWPTA